MRLPPAADLVRALEDGGLRLPYSSAAERERVRQAVLRAARGAGLVAYTRARGEAGTLVARAVRDAAPSVPPAPPRPRPYRPADARAPSSPTFVEGGFPERAIAGLPTRAEVRAAAELAVRARAEVEAAARARAEAHRLRVVAGLAAAAAEVRDGAVGSRGGAVPPTPCAAPGGGEP